VNYRGAAPAGAKEDSLAGAAGVAGAAAAAGCALAQFFPV
jgi:hypothetical protein